MAFAQRAMRPDVTAPFGAHLQPFFAVDPVSLVDIPPPICLPFRGVGVG